MLASLFGNVCSLELLIDPQPGRKMVALNKERKEEKIYVFQEGEDISGSAIVNLKPGKKLEHNGLRVELIGQIESLKDKSCSAYDFFTMAKDFEPAGSLYESRTYSWRFGTIDLSQETYWGSHVRLRYFVRLTLSRSYGGSIVKEQDFAVHTPISSSIAMSGDPSNSIKMEVGIEDCLHIEFEYDKCKYHLKDVVVGKVFFLLVRIKIKHMELDIVKSEVVGSGANKLTETSTVTKFEIMDGAAVKSECIPVRLYLSGYDLTPTYKNVQNKFSVRYFLNLVLVDEEERRYFKKQEIILYRLKPQEA